MAKPKNPPKPRPPKRPPKGYRFDVIVIDEARDFMRAMENLED